MYIDWFINFVLQKDIYIHFSKQIQSVSTVIGLIAPVTEMVVPVYMIKVVSALNLSYPGSHSECRL
jgi:hypothetical protein